MTSPTRDRIIRVLAAVVAATTTNFAAIARAQAPDEVAAIVQAHVDLLRAGSEVVIQGRSLASRVVLPDFYAGRADRPAWTEPAARADVLAALRSCESDGLAPADYHLPVLATLAAHEPANAQTTAEFDLLATDGLIRLAYHLRFGKVDPVRLDPDWNFPTYAEITLRASPAATLDRWAQAGTVAAGLDSLRPQHRMYRDLRTALARYRDIESAGGWKALAAGATLRPGDTDVRVPSVRARLAVEGEFRSTPGVSDASAAYDSVLVAAVQRFQERHGLSPDGVVGPGTLRALNVPAATRIDQLRLALESGRLLLHDVPARFVVVNVPAFRASYIDETGTVLESKVIVGKPYRRTPIFRSEMNSVVINPSWTIPPGIMQKDVLPAMRRDPNYLQKKGYRKIGNQIVQPPGPQNALGRIKLNFPNPHLVYLHDTPNKDLYAKDARTLSSGCIRVEEIIDLAVLVLDDPAKWSREQVEAAIATGKTRTISLERKVPVLLTYWTAVVRADGRVRFFEDVYERDPAFLRALDGPFRFRPDVTSQLPATVRR